MRKHVYYQLQIRLISPMNISSGENVNTDHDVLVDSTGNPYIPGSSMAGVLRDLAENENAVFGIRLMKDNEISESPVIVYDARLKEGTVPKREQRDHVKLNCYRTAEDKKKFDEECIEAGAVFIGYLEIPANRDGAVQDGLEKALNELAARKCGFGRKTTRGFGRAELTVVKKEFDLDQAEQKKAWLDFSPFIPGAFDGLEEMKLGGEVPEDIQIRMKLKLEGGISIRVYLTSPNIEGQKESSADFSTMKSNGNPVVPGSSWAGAFRHRYQELAKILDDDRRSEKALFGFVEENTSNARKSRITFSETVITGSMPKTMTRNAIDRASGKTKDSALYTEETCYGGVGELVITIGRDIPQISLQMLGACLCDFIHGYLPVGGLSSRFA